MSAPTPGVTADAVAGAIIIVAHDRPDLYEYFRTGFRGLGAVAVILDRRLRLHDPIDLDGVPSNRSRRWDPDIYDELLLRGFAIKRLE